MSYSRRKKKIKRDITRGQIHIQCTFNNSIVTVTDEDGNVTNWATSGTSGFKGSKKKTPYAAGLAAEAASKAAYDAGMRKAEVFLTGIGSGREHAVRAVSAAKIEVTAINDKTPIPHNGCRPPKRRRM